eukprot:gb/GEZN01001859.1/.p1 GENE.gb/GEZN01001859.1/~~gb/GEZN01001859.1/.p1  ORF type:complete len:698 (-),score=119.75 gb/GEZN01001859.1/:587-2680(-)
MAGVDYVALSDGAPATPSPLRTAASVMGMALLGASGWAYTQFFGLGKNSKGVDDGWPAFVPRMGMDRVVVSSIPAPLQVVPLPNLFRAQYIFLYSGRISQELTIGTKSEEGWVYGAKRVAHGKGAAAKLAIPTGNEGDVLKGKLLSWSGRSFPEKLAAADKQQNYDPRQDEDQHIQRRGVVSVVKKDGSVAQAYWFFAAVEPPVTVSSDFYAGNIEAVDLANPLNLKLKIQPEPYTEFTDKRSHFQWFYFRASNVENRDCTFKIINAAQSSYPEAWEGYRVVYSYDPSANAPIWRRTPTSFTNGILEWHFKSARRTVWFAYFAAYSYMRLQNLMNEVQDSSLAKFAVIGKSLDGRPMEKVRVGNGTTQVWLIGRQHPGESMASWWMEGALKRLIDPDDTEMAKLRELATVHVVPLMCPDGVAKGHLRTNSIGTNLNREWAAWPEKYGDYDAPTIDRSPEVQCVLREMRRTGVDLFFDVHGDEEIPNNFFCGTQGTKTWDDDVANLFVYLSGRALHHSKDFQIGRGYGQGAPDYLTENLGPNPTTASDAVAAEFDCLAVTLEMPFKDAVVNPDPVNGWSPDRCVRLGKNMLSAVLDVVPQLGPNGMTPAALKEVRTIKEKHPGTYWWDLANTSATKFSKAEAVEELLQNEAAVAARLKGAEGGTSSNSGSKAKPNSKEAKKSTVKKHRRSKKANNTRL